MKSTGKLAYCKWQMTMKRLCLKTRSKVRTDTRACHLTSTGTPWHTHTWTQWVRKHIIHILCIKKSTFTSRHLSDGYEVNQIFKIDATLLQVLQYSLISVEHKTRWLRGSLYRQKRQMALSAYLYSMCATSKNNINAPLL